MNKNLKPFDLHGFLSINAQRAAEVGLKPVTTQDWFDGQSNKPHPNGIFSADIFGAIGSAQRSNMWGYIDIKADVLHPHLYKDICSMSQFYAKIIEGKAVASFDNKTKTLVPELGEHSGTGYAFFMKHLPQIDFGKNDSSIRNEKIDLLDKHIKAKTHTTSALLVVPAGMRDVDTSEQHPSADEINDYYIRMLSISRTIDPISYQVDPSIYDTQSIGLLRCFSELYEYIINILSGKNGFMYAKLYSRNVQIGTRNVVTALQHYTSHADEESITNQHTSVGLYQYLQGTAPRAIFELRSKVIQSRIEDYDVQALVTNINTLRAERVKLTQSQFDRYASKEGLLSLFNYYENRSNRYKKAMVTGKHCLCLIYDDGQRVKLLSDIDELPVGFDKQYVRPVNYTELFTYCCYGSSKKTVMVPTRYPVATEGSTYISFVYLNVCHQNSQRILMNEDWSDSEEIIERWPKIGSDFFDSMSVHISRIDKLGLDHDGDMTNANFVLSDEAFEEAAALMKSKRYHIKPGGQAIWSPNSKTTDFVMNTLTA